MSNSDTQDAVVFIDANVPDLQDLLGGLAPGVQAFVLDPDRDGLQQIAAILAANDLTDLSSISIVGHGSSGAIDVGGTTLDDADLANYSAELAQIGGALAPGGDLQLYACDTAAGAAGQQFIADLSQYAGGAEVAAATQDIGQTAGGENWTLDATAGSSAAAPVAPFTDQALADFQGTLTLTASPGGHLWFAALNSSSAPGVEHIGVNGSSTATSPTFVNSGSPFGQPLGVAIDPAADAYFVTDQSEGNAGGGGQDVILEGSMTGGTTPTVIYTAANSNIFINGVTFDSQNNRVYFAAVDFTNFPSGTPLTGIYSISASGTGTRTATELIHLFSGFQAPIAIAIDAADNLLFFTNGFGNGETTVDTVEVANLTTGAIINSALATYSASGSQSPSGIAVDPVNHQLYWTTIDGANNSTNEIFSATYSVGSSVTLSNVKTLATSTDVAEPVGITLDVSSGVYYVELSSGIDSPMTIDAGSLSGGSLTTVYTASGAANGFGTLAFESTPVVTVGGTATYVEGGSPVTLDPGVQVSNEETLASATLQITNGWLPGDVLAFHGGTNTETFTDGDTITGSYSGSTLALTGVASAADYQTALASVTFSAAIESQQNLITDGSRTISWTTSDGVLSSSTPTTTVDITRPPGPIISNVPASVTDLSAAQPATLADGIVITAQSTNLAFDGATVQISGGRFVGDGDVLSVTNAGGVLWSYNPTSETLTLSGNDSVQAYEQALQSVTFNSTNSDPTNNGADSTRTITWTVTDAYSSSTTVTETVDLTPCYRRGTLIEAARGQKSVEELNIGDKVRTASGKLRPIKWIGRRSYAGRFVMGRKDILPVCIKSGALTDNVPARDLWVSPNHAMFLSGVLIEAKDLINGVSIVQAEAVETLEYFHIELETHDVIIAEGALSETFIDDDSRGMFHNALDYETLYDEVHAAPAHYCAPRLDEGYEVEAVRQRLALRSGLLRRSDTAQPGALRGYIDRVRTGSIAGWAQNADAPEAPVCLDIFADGKLIGQVLANSYRKDLKEAGLGSGRHAFEFTPPAGLAFASDAVDVRRSLDGAALEHVAMRAPTQPSRLPNLARPGTWPNVTVHRRAARG
jgi:hypothetical protein